MGAPLDCGEWLKCFPSFHNKLSQIGERIMEEMNGMKEKFDVALKRIDDELRKDQEEQNEMNMKNRKK